MHHQGQQNQTHVQSVSPLTRVVLGICGSISAYKTPYIVRELVKRGVEVRVVMTPSAREFVSPLVLENLSHHRVACDMFDQTTDGSWHISLARWCQAMLIAPCSASSLARLATGVSDSALSLVTLALPRTTPLFLAPAMDSDMWLHPATRRNVEQLRRDGARVIEPDHGELASGLVGPGRLPEPAELVNILLAPPDTSLRGKTVVMTAGPTREKLDDVRYLSNHSSGKMGYALAAEAARRGARVILVSGPVALTPPEGVEVYRVVSAQEMFDTVMAHREEADILIMAAAVADFRPAQPKDGKIKKGKAATMELSLERTPDILAEVGRRKGERQVVVGFALEAADHLDNARRKLSEKNCDLVILNAANQPDSGFSGDNNTITVLSRDGQIQAYPALTKAECAARILDSIP